MADSYTNLWTKDTCRRLKDYAKIGARFEVLFGGDHLSQPSFIRFGVKPGDYIYPITVNAGVLYILGRMRVKSLVSVDEFFENQSKYANDNEKYISFLRGNCTSHAAIGDENTPIRFDVSLSSDELESLRFRSKKAERGLKYIEDGKLKKTVSIQGGIFRLSPDSANLFQQKALAKM